MINKRIFLLNLVASFLFFIPPSWSSLSKDKNDLNISLKVEKFTLKNGLTVLLSEDHSVPMISYHTWYRVGSRDETPGVTGAAHMLEHMMFKGAKKYDGKSFDRIFHENGIINNAFTSYDYTGFYETLPSGKLELVMDMEVDRMTSLSLHPEDLLSEREVVKEERRWRVDNNPQGVMQELQMETMFKISPYRWPVIGYMKDISKFNVENLRFFYNTFYVPNNAVLVIVGDFETSKVKKLVETYYGALEYKPVPVRTYAEEPGQHNPEIANLKKNVQNSSFVLGFRAPVQGNPDSYALDLAANIIGQGRSSRLYKRLVYEKQLATSIIVENQSLKDLGILSLAVNVSPGFGIKESLKIVNEEIERLKKNKVTEGELDKSKTIIIKELVDKLETADGKAEALALNEILTGDYSNLFADLEKYNLVSVDDIQRVIKKYIDSNQRTLVVLEPLKIKRAK